jgi:hypothetical protein
LKATVTFRLELHDSTTKRYTFSPMSQVSLDEANKISLSFYIAVIAGSREVTSNSLASSLNSL